MCNLVHGGDTPVCDLERRYAVLLCPSLMCIDFARLGEEVDELAAAGADIFHLDVMDGHFVPNFALGLGDVEAVCRRSPIPCDVHLMVRDAICIAPLFIKAGAGIVYVHGEDDFALGSTLQSIQRAGAHPGLAVSPATGFESIEPVLPIVDYVLVMTVNPGFAGQKWLDYVDPKLQRICDAKERYGYQVVIDGACSPEAIARTHAMGVDGFVLGTSALFGKGRPYKEIMAELRQL